jgi:hypothetical protein
VSSLSWITRDIARSQLARRTNIAVTLLSTLMDAQVHNTVHVPGVDNIVFDGLSRGKVAGELALDPALQYWPDPASPLMQCVALCNPHLPLDTPLAHRNLTAALMALLQPL